jgi:hypothetical protein
VDPSTRTWVLTSQTPGIRLRAWLEPLVGHLCEEYNLENPLEDGSQASSIVTESDDSYDYEPIPQSGGNDRNTDSEGSEADYSERDEDTRPDAIAFLEYLWHVMHL